MKRDPLEPFFRWFVWASIAVVVLAIACSSGGWRLASLIQREVRDAIREQ